MNSSEKKKNALPQVISIVLYLAVGVCCGMAMTRWLPAADDSLGSLLLHLAVMVALLYAAIFAQLILHELGHLLFGLMTGYRFFSFRIGPVMLFRREGGMHLGLYSLAGTGGQCLMLPPETDDGNYPCALYHLGGAILNLAASVLFGALFFHAEETGALQMFCLFLALFGAVLALTNGIPMHLGAMDNDGWNALAFRRWPEARDAFVRQMQIVEQTANGVRLRDMPAEWFEMPSPEGMQNGLIASLAVFSCSRLMDAHAFADADRRMAALLNADTGIMELHRSMMRCDRFFCELVGERRPEVLSSILNEKQKKFMRAMRSNPSVLRTEYLNALLVEEDVKKSESLRRKFNRMAASYPYPTDVESERELIDIAESAHPSETKMTLEEAMRFSETEMPEIEMTLEEAMNFDTSAVTQKTDETQK